MPIPATAALGLLPGLFGGKQIGGVAPAFNGGSGQSPPTMPINSGGLLNINPASILSAFSAPNDAQGGVTEALAESQPVTSKPSVFNTDVQNAELDQKPGFIEGFFGNLDQNLQSPSKQIGLGLLSQLDPRLAGAGLLAGGLFGGNKLF